MCLTCARHLKCPQMSSWNAWRYPAFYIGPKYSLVDFTFKPPHTLFMDASLQAQQDADLIAPGDRANTDYVMDVVTHQPLCRHEAIKGADNVFYWNLDSRHQSQTVGLVQSTAQIVRHDGKMSSEGDLRANYEEWFWGLGKFDKDKSRLLRSRSKFLVGVTKPKNMAKWERITQNLLDSIGIKKQIEADQKLAPGEIRIEITTLKMSKYGLMRLGTLNPAAAAGDGLIIVKVQLPGDEREVCAPVPLRKGLAKMTYQKRATHEGEKAAELEEILQNPDPELSEVVLTVALCNKNGAELMGMDDDGNVVSKGVVGTARIGLQELIRDKGLHANGSAEHQGLLELSGIIGVPLKEDNKLKKPQRTSKAGAAAVEAEAEEEELPVGLGDFRVRIAVCPPDMAKAASTAAEVAGTGGGGGGGEGGSVSAFDTGAGVGMPTDLLALASMAISKKNMFKKKLQKVKASPEDSGKHDEGEDAPQVVGGTPGSRSASPKVGSPDDNVKPSKAASSKASDAGESEMDSDDGPGLDINPDSGILSRLKNSNASKKMDSIMYTFAYWIKWRPKDAIGDQLLFFGEPRNQPALIRGSKLGALVNNQFVSTEYDPRLAGDNWQLLVVTNDGSHSKFWIGFSSTDDSGTPVPARAMDPLPGADPGEIRTEFSADIEIRRLATAGKGAGLLAQAWIWPRALEAEEVRELWLETKKRYPLAVRGLAGGIGKSSYRAPPSIGKGGMDQVVRPVSAKKLPGIDLPPVNAPEKRTRQKDGEKQEKPWDKFDPIIAKDTAAMLEVPLSAKLAFQKLLNVFVVLVDYATFAESFIIIDRINNMSNTAELMIEIALRKNGGTPPTVMLLDHKDRLLEADTKLKQLIQCGFLIDEDKAYGYQKKLLSVEFAGAHSGYDLRRLVTPDGLAWLRASSSNLKQIEDMIGPMVQEVKTIFRQIKWDGTTDADSLQADGRPKMQLIWKNFYQAQLYASATHYIVFDKIDLKGKSLLSSLGTCGTIFLSGDTQTYHAIIRCVQDGSPLLLLESTGGVTQAFAYVMKAVRLLRSKWPVDFVMRLVTEYKARAARDEKDHVQMEVNQKYRLQNVQYLDKELARIDLMLAIDSPEEWMLNFGLPEVLMLFEVWQRAPDFLMRQLQFADVMKKNAEDMLDLFTGCFSGGAGGIPELGLGNAEVKVVATAWNRHLLLYNNARIYNTRSWIMQFVLYFMGFATTGLSVLTSLYDSINPTVSTGIVWLEMVMLVFPIIVALLGTISTRLRQREKFSVCKMASYEIVSEIYKFRVRAMEYDGVSLAAALNARKNIGKDKKKDDNEIVPPISAKEKDREARTRFVERIQTIYSNCMNSEMAKGTSITHKSNYGMDPARLLREEGSGNDDDEKETRKQLKEHVANRLYFLTTKEWALGVDTVQAEREHRTRLRNKRFNAMMKKKGKQLFKLGVKLTFQLTLMSIVITGTLITKSKQLLGKSMDPTALSKLSKPAAPKGGEDEEEDDQTVKGSVMDQKIEALKKKFAKYFDPDVPASSTAPETKQEAKPEGYLLDLTYADDDNEDEAQQEDEDAGGAQETKRIGDDFFSSLTIDYYMKYRAKAVCAYLEKTAPWRGFWMQTCEVLIFVFSSSGAVLVAAGSTPFVALTVAAASIVRSFLEFSNIPKQVEAYNSALNSVHTMMNLVDGMTRTERRKRSTIKKVVSTVENAMQLVAGALTDALPSGDDEEGGDGEGGGEGEEE